MGATEEQMDLVDQSSMDHVAYILILYSLAFLVFLFSDMLVSLYDTLTSETVDTRGFADDHVNGRPMEEGRLRAAEEFELDGLMSDDEGDEHQKMLRRSNDGSTLDTPSTLGKNNLASVR